jgi:hypothetical protein
MASNSTRSPTAGCCRGSGEEKARHRSRLLRELETDRYELNSTGIFSFEVTISEDHGD